MRIIGDLQLSGYAKNLIVQKLDTDPVEGTRIVGQIWYNTTSGKYKGWDGTSLIDFASGGNTQDILDKLDVVETGLGLSTSTGAYAAPSGTTYLGSASSLKDADAKLDYALGVIGAKLGVSGTLQGELDDTQEGAGLGELGAYTAPTGTNYLSVEGQLPTTLKGADVKLDAAILAQYNKVKSDGAVQVEANAIEVALGLSSAGAYVPDTGAHYIAGAGSLAAADVDLDIYIKAASDAASAANTNANGRLSRGGGSMTIGGIAMSDEQINGVTDPTAGTDFANKGYVDRTIGGLSWKQAVDSMGDTKPSTFVVGYRFLDTTDGKIYVGTVADTTWDAGTAAADDDAVFNKVTDLGYVYDAGTTTWIQFTGAGQVDAGVGLGTSGGGNTLDIKLGAGIMEMPDDGLAVDFYANGGVALVNSSTGAILTGSESTAVKNTAGLAVILNGTTLNLSSSGLKVAANGITEDELATSVAGAALIGGGGDPLAVNAGAGLTAGANSLGITANAVTGTMLNSSVAGNGLQGGGGSALAVKVGPGVTTAADALVYDETWGDARYVKLGTDTMTGLLILDDVPTTNVLGAITKSYMDAIDDKRIASTFVFDGTTGDAELSFDVVHNLGTPYVNITVYDENDAMIIPDEITLDATTPEDKFTVTFTEAIKCTVVATAFLAVA